MTITFTSLSDPGLPSVGSPSSVPSGGAESGVLDAGGEVSFASFASFSREALLSAAHAVQWSTARDVAQARLVRGEWA